MPRHKNANAVATFEIRVEVDTIFVREAPSP